MKSLLQCRRTQTLACTAILGSHGLACGPDSSAPIVCESEPLTIYDPFRHQVCIEDCTDALDCPRGSLCAKSEEGRSYCAIPSDALQTSRSALLNGFGVGEMTVELEESSALELTWKRPASASVVTCALFSCPPAFRVKVDGRWAEPRGDRRSVQIANYDRCVLAAKQFQQPEGAFNLRDRENAYYPTALASPNDAQHSPCKIYRDEGSVRNYPHCAPVTELTVGCWAYDATRIVAASQLVPINSARGMFNYQDIFVGSDDAACAVYANSDLFRVCVIPPPAEDGAIASGSSSSGALDDSSSAADLESSGDTTTSTPDVDAIPAEGESAGSTTGASSSDSHDSDNPPHSARYGVCACPDRTSACGTAAFCAAPCMTDCDCNPSLSSHECFPSCDDPPAPCSGPFPLGYCEGDSCVALPPPPH